MAKKALLKDHDNIEILPITRGELVLDSSGNQALHSTEFLATTSQPGLMSAEDKYKILNMQASSVANALTLKINGGSTEGTNLYTFNGSAAKTLNIVAGDNITLTPTVGALSISASIPATIDAYTKAESDAKYLPLTGGRLSAYSWLPLTLQGNNKDFTGLGFSNNGNSAAYLVYMGDKSWKLTNEDWSWDAYIIHSGNISSYLPTIPTVTDYYWANVKISNESNSTTTPTFGNINVSGNATATTFIGNLDGTYVNKLTGYTKATSVSAIATTDSLNTALGKLELKADTAYTLVAGAYDGDGTIENLAEILKVLDGIKDTETIQAIVGKYLPLTGGTIKGTLKIYRDAAAINYCSSGGTSHGWLGFSEADIPRVWLSNGSTSYPLLHTGNYSGYLDGRYYTETEVNNLLSNYLPINGTAVAASKLTSTKVFDFAASAATYCKVASINITGRYGGGSGLLKFYTNRTTSTETYFADSFEVFVHVYQQEALGQKPVLQFKSTNTGDAYNIIGILNYSSSGSTFDIYAYGKGRSYHGLYVTLVHGDITISPGSYISSLPSGEQIAPQAMGNSKLLNGYASSDFWKKTELTKLSQLTDDVVTGNYLPLAGGNMKNAAVITFTANGTLRQTTATTSNATSIVEWYKGTSKDPNYTHSAQIGWHNTGDTDGAIYLVPYPTSTDPWASSVGLYIGKTALKWNNQGIIHSGNIGSQSVNYATSAGSANTATSATSASYSRYLLGRNTAGADYSATSGNLVFAEWNTYSDNRWYLKASGYETRVGYANDSDKLDGIDSTGFLRQVVVANNTTNDFNTFGNMTLTGRVDPTTGASLVNAPWTGGGPAGGYGVLTYLFSGTSSSYGTQMAWGYNSNRIYIRNRYWGGSGVGSVWKTTWDSLALTSDLKNPTDYYWANVQISDQSNSGTSPTFANATTTGLLTVSTGGNHCGIKAGNTYINSINSDLILQNNGSIRFGTDSWDYNEWAGLKYVHSSKTISLGLADGSVFTANSAQSGGTMQFPGIGTFKLNGVVHVNSGNPGQFNDGIRLYSSTKESSWSNINFGCDPSAVSGTHSKQWMIGRNTSNNFMIGAGSNYANTQFEIDTSGNVDVKGSITGNTIYANRNGSSTSGGVSLYASSAPDTYGIMFRGTSSYGTHGGVTSDWATYFTMSDTTNRGWIFRRGSTNVASIAGTGAGSFTATGTDKYIAYPQGGQYTYSGGSITGAIKIKLPKFKSSTMLSMVVTIYNYSTGTSTTYTVGGYNYSDGNWYNEFAYSNRQGLSGYGNLPVRFGDDGSSNCIYIGETTTTWSYPNIVVSNVLLGHSTQGFGSWATGWEISINSSLGNINKTVTNPATNEYTKFTRYVIADNNAKDPGHALLQSGSGRDDASPSGDTWLFWDTLGGTSTPWGFKHEQAANLISFYGAGVKTVSLNLQNGNIDANGDLTLFAGDVDRYINFKYTGYSNNEYSWRIGYLGSGSGDANYLVFQSAGTSGSWSNALRLGLTTLDANFGGSVSAGQFIANNSSGPHFTGTSASGNWAYLRLNNSSCLWDIATRSDHGSGGLWLSRYAGGDNGIFVSASSTPKVGINTSSPSEALSVSGWVGTIGDSGWYSITHGGGMYMSDSTWVRTYNSKSFYCSANIQAGGRIYTGYDSGVSNSISCSNWFRSNGNTGWYNPTNECHVYPNNISSYGGLVLRGVKSGYHGFLLGTSTGYMNLMDNGTDKGLYQENQSMWILYYNASNKYVGIRTSSLSYPLTINGDSYTNGWSRSANGFYVHDTGVHFTHQGTLGEIDMTSNNEFLWGSSSADLYFNYRSVSRGTTVTHYRWHAGSSSSYATHTLGALTANGNQTLYGLTSTCNYGNSASYTNAAMQIREYNFGGAQTDTWGNAPRLAWHWSGRVQAQIGLASDNHLYISEDGSFGSPKLIIHAGNIGSQSVNYATSAGSADSATTAGIAGKLSLVSCYNGTSNNDLWSTIKSSNNSYLGTATVYEVYNDGGPTTYGHVLDIVTVHSNHWQSQLWFDAGKSGRLRYRNKDYNNNSWGSWGEVAWTSDIPSVGNGTVTITQNGSNVGSFTMNQSGDTTIALTDTDTNTNYYPIRSYASGLQISSYSGSTNCQLWVPYATSSQAGVVSTSTQTFAGEKTFSSVMTASDGIKLGSYGKIGYGSLDSTYTESVPSVTDSYGIWIGTKGTSSTSLESSGMAITGDTVYFWSPHDKPMYYFDSDTTSYPNTNYYVHEVLNTATGLGKKGLLSAYSFYKTPGGTSITGTAGLSGVSISSSRPRAGKYTLTITNNRAVSIVIHAPVLTPIISDYGGGSCYRSAYTELYSDNTYRFPYSLSAGSSIAIAFGCGYIHTQGSWSSGDFTKSNDDVGFSGILPISH